MPFAKLKQAASSANFVGSLQGN